MINKIIDYLKDYKKVTISLGELEGLLPGSTDYNSFANTIRELIDRGILTEKNAKINNGKDIPLAYKFAINKYELRREHIDAVQKLSFQLSSEIDLQQYFTLSEEIWRRDLPYIMKVNEYIAAKGLPDNYATCQERSFHIVGDEKWIDEKGGKKLLERMNLWHKLKLMNASDPLMLAVNPLQFNKSEYSHLIVENKAAFTALMDTLQEISFTSLIFGSGWKIVSNITMLEKQLGLKGEHKFYYFGDLDYEGISIWNSLNERVQAELAIPFYTELIKKSSSIGKEGQQRNVEALNNFLQFFSREEQGSIVNILDNKRYLPQEGLNKEELSDIWRSWNWL
ncbi:MAG: DUF2220 family protein [Bacillota bacterium]|nr:DUF2220 family protein [Bacillota bacterium]